MAASAATLPSFVTDFQKLIFASPLLSNRRNRREKSHGNQSGVSCLARNELLEKIVWNDGSRLHQPGCSAYLPPCHISLMHDDAFETALDVIPFRRMTGSNVGNGFRQTCHQADV